MSGVADTYHLRGTDQNDGLALLKRADVSGFVFPPKNGWVTILVEGEPFIEDARLIRESKGLLAHHMWSEDFGVVINLYADGEPVANYQHNWDQPVSFVGAERWAALIGKSTAECEDVVKRQTSRADRFAEVLGLPNCDLDYPHFSTESKPGQCGAKEFVREQVVTLPADMLFDTGGPGMVPDLFYGLHSEVSKRCRALVKKAIKNKSWDAALKGAKWVNLDDTDCPIVVYWYVPWYKQPAFLMYELHEVLFKLCEKMDHEEWLKTAGALIDDGKEQFWYCLCAIAKEPWMPSDPPGEAIYRGLLGELCRWWRDLCKYEFRLTPSPEKPEYEGWPDWCREVGAICSMAGMPEEKRAEVRLSRVDRAGVVISEWLAAQRR